MTTETKHTPGPWADHDASCTFEVHEIEDGYGRTIATLDQFHHLEDGDWRREEVIANARLIAAAPDLLVACEAARNLIEITITYEAEESHAWQLLSAAIAKAKGNDNDH